MPKFAVLEQPELPSGFEFPVVVKARRNGYDGQGTFVIKAKSALVDLYHRYPDTPFLVEEFVAFDRELAIIAAKLASGSTSNSSLVAAVWINSRMVNSG